MQVDQARAPAPGRRRRSPRRPAGADSPAPTSATSSSSTSTSVDAVVARRPGRPAGRLGTVCAQARPSPRLACSSSAARAASGRSAPADRSAPQAPAEHQVQQRHAHRDAVRHLVLITARGRSATSEAISTPRFIGPGCMTSACSGSGPTRAARQPEQARVLADAREVLLALAFPLDAQHVADVELRQDRRRGRARRPRPTPAPRAGSAWAARPA